MTPDGALTTPLERLAIRRAAMFALVLTRWGKISRLSCRSCATKRQLMALGSGLLLGWWGFPFGLLLTPLPTYRSGKA